MNAIGRLRNFVVLLVVAHHAVLAYNPFAPPAPRSLADWPPLWRAFPVADAARWSGFALFNEWCDLFFMALLFFLSGLFVLPSLRRKGPGRFLGERALRLGLPFLLLAGVLAPLAYVPAYLQTGAPPSFAGFWRDFLAGGDWSSGPAWFLWVLLVFDALAAAVFVLTRAREAPRPRRAWLFFIVLVAASAAAYVPLTMAPSIGPFRWTSVGPFAFQTSRIGHYLVYFAAGAVAAPLLDAIARGWPAWTALAAAAFITALDLFPRAMTNPALALPANLLFALVCAATCFALIALFVRFARAPGRPRSSYGIYIVHYPIVSWLGFALVALPWPGLVKGLAVTVGAIALSWLVASRIAFPTSSSSPTASPSSSASSASSSPGRRASARS